MHRCKNILIKSKPPDEWCVKLCDLGLSRRSLDASGTTSVLGTHLFKAPEIRGIPFDGDPWDGNDFATDIWSMGETLSQMMTGEATFLSGDLLGYQRGRRCFPLGRFSRLGLSDAAIDFVSLLMKASPDQRPTADQALEHPWMQLYSEKEAQATGAESPVAYRVTAQPTSARTERKFKRRTSPTWQLVTDQPLHTPHDAEASLMRPLLNQHGTNEAMHVPASGASSTQRPPVSWLDFPLQLFRLQNLGAPHLSISEAFWLEMKLWLANVMTASIVTIVLIIAVILLLEATILPGKIISSLEDGIGAAFGIVVAVIGTQVSIWGVLQAQKTDQVSAAG